MRNWCQSQLPFIIFICEHISYAKRNSNKRKSPLVIYNIKKSKSSINKVLVILRFCFRLSFRFIVATREYSVRQLNHDFFFAISVLCVKCFYALEHD